MQDNEVEHPDTTATGEKTDQPPQRPTRTRGKDFDVASWIEKVRQLPDVRRDLVKRVKGEIAADTYDTPERLNTAVDKMMDELF